MAAVHLVPDIFFDDAAIRIRTNITSDGFIYENKRDECNFSVRGSDGLGYFRGGLVIAKDASNADDFFPEEISHNAGGTHIGGYSGGNYQGSDYIEPGYLGVVIITTPPNQMKLTKYNFTQRKDGWGLIRAPAKYRIYGSNDDINWTLLFDKTATPSYVNYFFEESVTTTGVYKYFALVVNKVTGEGLVNYSSWVLFGQEVNKKFSVDASNGSGYFAGDLTTSGNLTTSGGLFVVKDASSNADDFLPEQRYPPRALTSLNDTISGQSYGNGLYVASASVTISVSATYGVFYGGYHGRTAADYVPATGYFSGNAQYIVNGYYGTWIKLQLPVAIKLTKYGFGQNGGNVTDVRAPGEYKIYGSNDNINWVELVHKTSTITYTDTKFEESVTTTGTYKYIALVVNKLVGTGGQAYLLNFHNFAIYGQEVNKKFSVDASDGSGYFAGDLTTNGNISSARMVKDIGGSSHAADKRSTFEIGRKDGGEFLGMKCVVATASSVSEQYDNQGYITFNTWGNNISISREVMRINQRGHLSAVGNVTGSGIVTNFTGNHNCKASTIDLYDDKYIGYIVSSSKQYSSLNSTYHKDNIKQNINKEKNDCLPYVQLTSKENDKNAFGIIYKIENETDTERKQENGGFFTIDSKKPYDRRIVVAGCGEGFIWVSDYNGNIEAGDFISSSPIPGIGMKQNDDLFHTFTVAKITMDCDFNPGYIPVKVLQSSNYDVEYITTSNIINSSNVQENEVLTSNYEVEYISDTIDIINTSNITTYLKDDNGEYLYENLLDSNGNVVYDFEYEMKYIKLDGTITDAEEFTNGSNVYRMALVGSCYKCS